MDVTEQLSALIYNANSNMDVDKAIMEARILINQGADVNDEIHYDDYYESLLALVCRKLYGEYDKLKEFNFRIAEELVIAGAKINEYGFTYYNNQFKDDYGFEDYTPLDYVILEGGKYGINQDTYRLAKIMVTSLHQNGMKEYLKKYRHPDTFHGLQNIFKEFGYFDKYMRPFRVLCQQLIVPRILA